MYTGISRLECKNHTLFVTKMAKISLNWYPIYDQNNRKTIPFVLREAVYTPVLDVVDVFLLLKNNCDGF